MTRRSPTRSTRSRARKLYLQLFGPIDGQVQGLQASGVRARRPDAAAAALSVDQPARQGLDAYLARQAKADADPFDMRGVDWLGRGREISISVSPRSFLDLRAIAPSHARRAYLGLGTNTRGDVAAGGRRCRRMRLAARPPGRRRSRRTSWRSARRAFGPANSEIITGAAFTDTALLNDDGHRQLPDPALRHPRAGDGAAARLPAAAGAGHRRSAARVRTGC